MRQAIVMGSLIAAALTVGVLLWRVVWTESKSPVLAATDRGAESLAVATVGASSSGGSIELAPDARPSAARQQPDGRRRAFDRLRADGIRQRAAGASAAVPGRPFASASARSASALPPLPPAPNQLAPEEQARRRQYLQDAVREQYFPIARSCYQELLGRKPRAAGKMVMSFAIVGDGEDGVVDRVEIGEGTTLDDPEFTLCMRESMYSIIFEPPPPGAEETTVVYPIELSPDPPDASTTSPIPSAHHAR